MSKQSAVKEIYLLFYELFVVSFFPYCVSVGHYRNCVSFIKAKTLLVINKL